ncbi:pentapeptide repeat-containing protein [Acaryochloris sp. 'Moss Beach']|uniref:pentapeptide repeat-containing protein n=1 Tax=Acaryochloris sp. 'Moss Beach' TaxID=2740837 RepID=UPI001F3E6315|nr:pentapeptide repeat-containing protein [Acaryochloris sp. 'Moss Beach']UJB69609.1 pentapeptide repeat-containing protein [Acaryochloris sp. 'Moss Beach']
MTRPSTPTPNPEEQQNSVSSRSAIEADTSLSKGKEGLSTSMAGLKSTSARFLRSATTSSSLELVTGAATVVLILGLLFHNSWIGLPAAVVVLWLSLRVLWPPLSKGLQEWVSVRNQQLILAGVLSLAGLIGVIQFTGVLPMLLGGRSVNWEAVGALADSFGAIGQILVAFLALFVAWRQYVISKELTEQQNRITQQQTIDAYFQGISDLVINEEGLLEDWPPERAIAEGRTAAILTGLSGEGKAKVIRFLSSSKLLTPLKRDRRLGRAIFDGLGGYEEDLEYGVRVIDLVGMLANVDLSGTDLRRTEMSEANLVHSNLQGCDLGRANLSRCILYGANLSKTDLTRARFFYGEVEQVTPRDRMNPPNFQTGAQTGAVIENADFSKAEGLSEEQRYYCCAWGGKKTRATIPGGCEGIPNKLESSR